MQFTFDASRTTVSMSGAFTFTDHTAFSEITRELLGTPGPTLAIELSGLEFIDSAGLGMLLIVKDEAVSAGRKLVLRSPRGQVARIFSITRFGSLFAIDE